MINERVKVGIIPGNDCVPVAPIDCLIGVSLVPEYAYRVPGKLSTFKLDFTYGCGHLLYVVIPVRIFQFPAIEEHGGVIGVSRNINALLNLEGEKFILVKVSAPRTVHHFYGSRVFKNQGRRLRRSGSKIEFLDHLTKRNLCGVETTCVKEYQKDTSTHQKDD